MLGWRQHALAHAANIPPWKITFWETGRTELTDAELERVRNALARRAKEVTDALAAA